MATGESIQRGVPSILGTLRAGIAAGGLAGLVLGIGDGVRAVLTVPAPPGVIGPWSGALCIAAAVLQYAFLGACGLAVLGAVLHPWLRSRDFARRYRLLLGIGLGLAVLAPLFWHSRSFVFPGYSAVSLQRLSSAALMLGVSLALGWRLAALLTSLGPRAQRVLAALLALCVITGGVFLAGQRDLAGARGVVNERNRELPNVLLVVVDALRQDALGCYGNARAKTPNLDRLAAQGVLFEHAFVQAPFTWTSFGSLLTGKYPRRHGLMKMKPDVAMVEQVTLPWHLKHATRADGTALATDDYLTASFHTGTLQEKSKLLRGFDLVFEETAGHDLYDVQSAWSRVRSELYLWTFQNRVRKRFDSGLVASEAKKFLEGLGGRRFMAMVHLYTTHVPYDPPRELAALHCDPAYTGPIHSFTAAHREAIEQKKYEPTPADVQQVRDLYAGGASHADQLIGSLLATLERNGMRENTLVIVTADHGESLGEDGLWEHNHLVRRELTVPLILFAPGRLPAGKRVGALVDEIDVLPTVCELAGLRLPDGTGEREILDGKSLMPLVRGEENIHRLFSFAETGGRVSILNLEGLLSVPRSVLEPDALAEAERLLDAARRDPERRPRLVRVAPAGANEVDVFDAERAGAIALLAPLHAWSRSMPIPVFAVVESDRDIEDLLRGTGYDAGINGDEETPPPKKQRAPQDGADGRQQ